MSRLTIRDWLSIFIGSALGIGYYIWALFYSGSQSGYILFPAALCPFLGAFITGFTSKRNERTLCGITVLIVYYSLMVTTYFSSENLRWLSILSLFFIIICYFGGRFIGYLD